jgi:hypothetical protein
LTLARFLRPLGVALPESQVDPLKRPQRHGAGQQALGRQGRGGNFAQCGPGAAYYFLRIGLDDLSMASAATPEGPIALRVAVILAEASARTGSFCEFPSERISFGTNFLRNEFPSERISFGTNFLRNEFPSERISFGTNSFGTNFLRNELCRGTNFLRNELCRGGGLASITPDFSRHPVRVGRPGWPSKMPPRAPGI